MNAPATEIEDALADLAGAKIGIAGVIDPFGAAAADGTVYEGAAAQMEEADAPIASWGAKNLFKAAEGFLGRDSFAGVLDHLAGAWNADGCENTEAMNPGARDTKVPEIEARRDGKIFRERHENEAGATKGQPRPKGICLFGGYFLIRKGLGLLDLLAFFQTLRFLGGHEFPPKSGIALTGRDVRGNINHKAHQRHCSMVGRGKIVPQADERRRIG